MGSTLKNVLFPYSVKTQTEFQVLVSLQFFISSVCMYFEKTDKDNEEITSS